MVKKFLRTLLIVIGISFIYISDPFSNLSLANASDPEGNPLAGHVRPAIQLRNNIQRECLENQCCALILCGPTGDSGSGSCLCRPCQTKWGVDSRYDEHNAPDTQRRRVRLTGEWWCMTISVAMCTAGAIGLNVIHRQIMEEHCTWTTCGCSEPDFCSQKVAFMTCCVLGSLGTLGTVTAIVWKKLSSIIP